MTDHADIDHTGLTGVGGGGFTEQSTVEIISGDLTTSSTTFVDATGITVTITTAAVRCLVIATLSAIGPTAPSNVAVDLAIDGTREGQTYGLTLHGAGNCNLSFSHLTDVLSAASHTFKIQWRVDGGTGTLRASTVAPARLTVIETSMTA